MMPPAQYPIEVDGAVLAALDDTRRALIELGAEVCETPFPFDFHDMMLRNGLIIAAEAYALHREYIEDASLPFGKHVRARVLAGRPLARRTMCWRCRRTPAPARPGPNGCAAPTRC